MEFGPSNKGGARGSKEPVSSSPHPQGRRGNNCPRILGNLWDLDSPGSRRIYIPNCVCTYTVECVSNINISNMWPKKSRASGSIHLPRGIPEDGVGSRGSENGETVKEWGIYPEFWLSLSLSLSLHLPHCRLLLAWTVIRW